MLHADNLVLMSETLEIYINTFNKWHEARVEMKGLYVNFQKTEEIASGGIPKNRSSISKVYLCGINSL